MAIEVVLPQLGESVAEGLITRWLKHVGDAVILDEPLVEITTDKVNVELPAPASGILTEIRAAEGETVPVEHVIAVITESGTATSAAPKAAEEVSQAADSTQVNGTSAESERRHFSPLVRRMAKEHGLDLGYLLSSGKLTGTGEQGRVSKADILEYLAGSAAAKPEDLVKGADTDVVPLTPQTVVPSLSRSSSPLPPSLATQPEGDERDDEIVVPFTGIRKMIADHLTRSAFTAPHVTTVAQADVTRLVAFRTGNKATWEQEYGLKLTYTPFFVKAAAEALLAFPMVNSTIVGDKIIAKKYVHMGVAVSLGEGGLIVPVIKNAHKLDLMQIARELESLARKAREGKLQPVDVQGGTFSITNPGVYGAIISTPIINAPQSAILGVEAIQRMPVVRDDDSIAIRSMMYLCLSYDHRVVDGETAIRFLQHIRKSLEEFRFFR